MSVHYVWYIFIMWVIFFFVFDLWFVQERLTPDLHHWSNLSDLTWSCNPVKFGQINHSVAQVSSRNTEYTQILWLPQCFVEINYFWVTKKKKYADFNIVALLLSCMILFLSIFLNQDTVINQAGNVVSGVAGAAILNKMFE